MTTNNLTSIRFAELNLPKSLLQGIEQSGFSYCTPIQAETLPFSLAGKDVAGQAQTGTGKSAAFIIAILNRLLSHSASVERQPTQIRALVLAPTRELAIQIHEDAVQLAQGSGITMGLAYGGTDYEKQRHALADGIDLLIGTPGRTIDYFKQHVFDLKRLEVMVLDEADRMFDLGFIKDIRYLLQRMPPPHQRLNMLFSATLSHRVMELAYEHMNNPEQIDILSEQVTADRVEQSVYYPASEEKIALLLALIQRYQPERAILFVNTKRVAERLWGYLEGNGHRTSILSGDVPQRKRQQLLEQFKAGEYPFLVATDVAARGLHISAVTHVFNYDLPQDAEDYVHRIGRTARAGATGMAISFACEQYAYSLMEIEEFLGHKIPVVSINSSELITPKPPLRPQPRSRPPHEDKRHGQSRRRSQPASNKKTHHQQPPKDV